MPSDENSPPSFRVDLAAEAERFFDDSSRNAARGDYDISSAFCQDFHRQWLLAAARGERRPQ
jgi:hypothetical protein